MFFFFFKQKTAYEMRISDWSSDVCSSDLEGRAHRVGDVRIGADLLFVVDDLAAPLGDVKEDANLFGVARPRPRPRGGEHRRLDIARRHYVIARDRRQRRLGADQLGARLAIAAELGERIAVSVDRAIVLDIIFARTSTR